MTQPDDNKISLAVKAASMYYYHGLTTDSIANKLQVSRSTISRLLNIAREEGSVNFSVVDPSKEPRLLEKKIVEKFNIQRAHVVQVPEITMLCSILPPWRLLFYNYEDTH